MTIAMVRYRRRMKKFGETNTERQNQHIKQIFTFQAAVLRKTLQMKAVRESLLPFLQEIWYRENLKIKHRKVMETVLFIQRRFKVSVVASKARLEALSNYWQKIHNELIKQSKLKKPNSKIIMLAKKLHYVKVEVKQACIHKYLEACKFKHALAFFQWRTKFKMSSGDLAS